MIVADVTGSDANIMFELGYAVAAGKRVLPVVNGSQGSVPSALAGHLFLVYDASRPDNIQFLQALRRWAAQNASSLQGAFRA